MNLKEKTNAVGGGGGKAIANNTTTCLNCDAVPERLLFSWENYCQGCAEIEDDLAHEWRTQIRVHPSNRKLRLPPRRHRGETYCWNCNSKSNLIVLYDEMCDEWLFCTACRHFKQLLRVWNAYFEKFCDLLERPIVFNEDSTFETEEEWSTSSESGSSVETLESESSFDSRDREPVELPFQAIESSSEEEEDEDDEVESDLPPVLKRANGLVERPPSFAPLEHESASESDDDNDGDDEEDDDAPPPLIPEKDMKKVASSSKNQKAPAAGKSAAIDARKEIEVERARKEAAVAKGGGGAIDCKFYLPSLL